MEEVKEVKKSEEEILFPEAQVGEITIKPWSFGMLFDISDDLDKLIETLDDKGILVSFENDFISLSVIMKLFTVANQELMNIIVKTTKVDEPVIKDLPIDDGIRIVYIIAKQNWETIKNAVAPLFMKKQEIQEKEEVEQDK